MSLSSIEKYRFLEYLKACGNEARAIKQSGVKIADFNFTWNTDAEFRGHCEDALMFYEQTSSLSIQNSAKKALADYLNGRMEKVLTSTTTTIYPDGTEMVTETVKRIPVGIPIQLVEAVLGLNQTEIQAIAVFARAGWLPPWLHQAVNERLKGTTMDLKQLIAGVIPKPKGLPSVSGKKGLTAEDQSVIKRMILGIGEKMDVIPAEVEQEYRYDAKFEREYGLRDD